MLITTQAVDELAFTSALPPEEEDEPPSTAQLTPVLAPLRVSMPAPTPSGAPIFFPVPSNHLTHLKKTVPSRSCRFRKRFFPDASVKLWNNWHWQVAQRVRTPEKLRSILHLSAQEEAALTDATSALPLAITPYYLSLLDPDNPNQPLRRTVVPTVLESQRSKGEADDPLDEARQSPIPGLVHRYPDRVLLLLTSFCSTYCRYCTRSRVVGHNSIHPGRQRLEAAFAYIAAHPEIRDVLLSGGDPLLLSDEQLNWVLSRLRRVPHVEIIRIGSKVPAVLPQRITSALVRMLHKHHPLMLSLHFAHPDECTPETSKACARLADAGIPLGSQTVLLAGVNDDASTMAKLMHGLLKMRVRPYYLYQCDPISGSVHFRTPVDKGLDILRALRGHTSGYAVPTYVIDAPGGGGKIPLMPESVLGRDTDGLALRNYEGGLYHYPDFCR
ncbi:MAG: KamA family radical SAM protein [Desulfobulbaceae bacterium]|nr:KamA family radical SAM protein [Desulfobulbaceae bacterium]